MPQNAEKRTGGDRRRHPRGGRRAGDLEGFSPLIFVVDPRPTGRETAEAILATLRFAVAPFDSIDRARRALAGLRPDLVLVPGQYLDEMRSGMPDGPEGDTVPLLALPDGDLTPATLVDDVRRALRSSRQ